MERFDSPGRQLPLAAGSPAANMSLDQALLESVDENETPTLRFYTWQQPTLSLGYFQSLGLRQSHDESHGLDVVRRATGGGAIVHHHELTYCIAWPAAKTSLGARQDLYRGMHEAVIRTLADWGIRADSFGSLGSRRQFDPDRFLCFQRRTEEDLIVAGYKILGSAQRRGQRAVLQHGSLLLKTSEFAPQLPGLEDLSGKNIEMVAFADALAAQVADRLGVPSWQSQSATAAELRRAEAIAHDRFENPAWLNRR